MSTLPTTAPGEFQPRNRYIGIVVAAMQQAITYRFMAFTSIIANFLWIVILFYLWRAAFAGRERIEGFSWDQMRTYIMLAYGINALIGFSAASKMMAAIRQGDIVIDLIRPINYLRSQLAATSGLAVIEGAISFTLVLLIGIFVLNMELPASILGALLFPLSLLLGFLTKFLFVFLVSLLAFWTMNSVGLNWTQTALVNIFAGVLIPIQFLPGWLAPVAEWSPLRGIVSTPVGIYLGQYEGGRLVLLLGVQIAWAVVLWIAAEWAWPRAFRAVEIQGG